MSPWSTALDPRRPALLHAGRGTGWWWPGRPVVADPYRIWILDRDQAWPVVLAGADQVLSDGPALLALAGRSWARITGDRVFYGESALREGPPIGARIWIDQGFVYRSEGGRTSAVEALSAGERIAVGPRGALLVGAETWTRGGLPGRSPRPLERPLLPSPIRWSEDGRTVAGIDPDEEGAIVDLATGRSQGAEGVPVSVDAWLRGTSIVRGDEVFRRGITEASAARWGDRLAGPGGRIWWLATGRPLGRRGVVALGVTVGTPNGFVTIDWATHRGWTVDPRGSRCDPFRLPIDDRDTVIAGIWEDGAVHLETALGERLRWVDGRIEPGDRAVEPPEEAAEIETPAGPFEASGTAEIGAFRYAWNDDGWLLAWPLALEGSAGP